MNLEIEREAGLVKEGKARGCWWLKESISGRGEREGKKTGKRGDSSAAAPPRSSQQEG